MQRLSFLQPTQDLIMSYALDTIVGTKRVSVLAAMKENYILYGSGYSSASADQPAIFEPSPEFDQFVLKGHNFEWYADYELPITGKQVGKRQVMLEDENNRTILALRFQDPSLLVNAEALVLLVFTSGTDAMLGMTRNPKPLSAREKRMLGQMAWNSCTTMIKNVRADRDLYSVLLSQRDSQSNNMKLLQTELAQKENMWIRSVESHAQYIASKIGEREHMRIMFTQAALESLKKFEGDLNDVEQSIERSVQVSINLAFEMPDELLLDKHDLILQKAGIAERSEERFRKNAPVVVGRLSKTQAILDRYEEAARRAKLSSQRVIGKIIGSHCDPPISNAAISDSLKNHADRIVELFNKYPERWRIIRTEFRSVMNIEERNDRDSMVS